jgi:hypothetical protein
MGNSNCKSVYTLNCILSNKSLEEETYPEAIRIKEQIDNILHTGYAVRVGSTATGHTLSEMVELAGENYIKNHYDVEVVHDFWDYYKLKEEA